jgi:hypothetical protein
MPRQKNNRASLLDAGHKSNPGPRAHVQVERDCFASLAMTRGRAARHLIASGLTGEPTAPVIGIAGATNMNS